jgi:hypothetical protein
VLLRHAVLAVAFVLGSAGVAYAQIVDDAWINAEASELVRLARLRRISVDRQLEAYNTIARERMTVRLRSGAADRLFLGYESVARIDWRQDGPLTIEPLAVHTSAPVVAPDPYVPRELGRFLVDLAWEPANPEALLLFDSTVVRHPLADGGEAHYRYESGDTTVLRLPDGNTVRLRELRIVPRRRHPQLINGSFWLDAETHALVRAYFRIARAYDADVDQRHLPALAKFLGITSDDGRPDEPGGAQMPGFLKPVRADLEFIAIEYGLWSLRWWLPRRVAWRGLLQVGRLTFRASYERTYDDYTVQGDTAAGPLQPADSLMQGCRRRIRYIVAGDSARPDTIREAWADSARARRQRHEAMLAARRAEWGGSNPIVRECAHELIVAAPPDSVLLHSARLTPSLGNDFSLIDDDALRGIIAQVRSIPDPPCCALAPRFQWGPTGPGLVRYNRVEGLSIGARVLHDLTPSTLISAEARIGIADRDPRAELAIVRRGAAWQLQLAGYRRLLSTTPAAGLHGTFASFGAFLFGRDEHEWFDAAGGELSVHPADMRTQWLDLRLYAERQRSVRRNTDFNLLHLLDSDTFRENFMADPATQFGARIRVRGAIGSRPDRPRIAGELSLAGETGDFVITRQEATVHAITPLRFGLSLAIEAGAGTVEGATIPAQSLWRLGGAATLRGYPGAMLAGERFWRTRVELGFGVPSFRLRWFTDGAWAGHRHRFDSAGALRSMGVGIGLLDGLLNVDLARGLNAPRTWRLHLHVNGRR